MNMLSVLIGVVALVADATAMPATFELTSTLSSHMVLQRGVVNTLWGSATSVQTISVTVGDALHGFAHVTNASDTFEVDLPPFTAGDHGDIVITSSTGYSVSLVDVLFGDVHLCSGQSNMVFSVGQSFSGAQHIAEANDPKYRSIRLLTVKATGSSTPLTNATILQPWVSANSTTVGNMQAFSYFSAVCWYTGVNLFKTQNGSVPIGLLCAAVGGTRVHQWSSTDALSKCNQSERALSTSFSEADSMFDKGNPQDSVHYNAMIAPMLKQRFISIFWVQGESDVNPTDNTTTMQPQRGGVYYACAIKAMVADWRVKFALPSIPFMWVLLSPWVGHEAATSYYQLPAIRAAQFAVDELALTGFASAIDLGDPDPTTNPWGGVHWRTKWPVGVRLAALAQKLVYNNTTIQTTGPLATTATATSSTIEINFDKNSLGAVGLKLQENICPFFGDDNNLKRCGWMEVETSPNTFTNSSFKVVNNQIVVSTSALSLTATPISVRYCYADWPVATIYNEEGLPATPFWLQITTI